MDVQRNNFIGCLIPSIFHLRPRCPVAMVTSGSQQSQLEGVGDVMVTRNAMGVGLLRQRGEVISWTYVRMGVHTLM